MVEGREERSGIVRVVPLSAREAKVASLRGTRAARIAGGSDQGERGKGPFVVRKEAYSGLRLD